MVFINDVATDLEDIPTFRDVKLGTIPDAQIQQQKATYDLKPLCFEDKDHGTVFSASEAAARKMPRWNLTHVDKDQGIIEGVATTMILRFKDDFVIRVRASDEATLVDMRSKSRLGKSDLGANKRRIETYFSTLAKELPKQ